MEARSHHFIQCLIAHEIWGYIFPNSASFIALLLDAETMGGCSVTIDTSQPNIRNGDCGENHVIGETIHKINYGVKLSELIRPEM